MRTQITLLREQLARHIRSRSADDPQVEHLRWQIASLERQARWREDAAGMFGTPLRAADRARAPAQPPGVSRADA